METAAQLAVFSPKNRGWGWDLGWHLGWEGWGVRTLSGGGGPVALVPKLRDAGMHQAVSRV